MSAETSGHLVMALLASGLIFALAGWTPVGRQIWAPLSGAALLGAVAVAGGSHDIALADGPMTAVMVALAALLATAGGGPITTLVFELVDRNGPDSGSLGQAGQTLRGGVWIGCLERIGVVVSLLAGWPEGVAIVLAVKGLGRYPELRAPGAAERFIIGTFTSVLWAAGCAGVVVLSG